MKIWSPQIIGVEVPSPVIFTFHLMFVSWSHFVSGLPVGAAPVPSGPRHCGQFVSEADWPNPTDGSAREMKTMAASDNLTFLLQRGRTLITLHKHRGPPNCTSRRRKCQ